MSFTTDVKDELSRVEPQCKTCAKAMLSALVKSLGTLKFSGSGNYSLEFSTENAWIARFALQNFREIYNLEAILTYRRSVLHGSQNYLIELLKSKNLIKSLVDMGIIEISKSENLVKLSQGIKQDFLQKECCSAAYLRGAFLGSGYVSEPKGDFHFEISVERQTQANDIKKILLKKDIKGGICARRNTYLFYIKSGQGISDFLAYTGAHKAALKMETIRVKKSCNNQANRQTNADMANAKRSVDAAYNHIIMSYKVAKHYGLENLSPAIQEFIKLRIKHRNLSLSELGKLADPPLSKSAVNSRARRLEKLAKEI